jgi:hypothetical protein
MWCAQIARAPPLYTGNVWAGAVTWAPHTAGRHERALGTSAHRGHRHCLPRIVTAPSCLPALGLAGAEQIPHHRHQQESNRAHLSLPIPFAFRVPLLTTLHAWRCTGNRRATSQLHVASSMVSRRCILDGLCRPRRTSARVRRSGGCGYPSVRCAHRSHIAVDDGPHSASPHSPPIIMVAPKASRQSATLPRGGGR